MSAPRPAKADRPPRGSSKVAKPHLLESGPHKTPVRVRAPGSSRRGFFFKTSAAAAAAVAAGPSLALLAGPGAGGLFQRGVASGDPLSDRVILWTRVTLAQPRSVVNVSWLVARDPAMSQVVQRGSAKTNPARDYTVKVDAAGLQPGTTYYYRFKVDGQDSPVGRTRTLPVGAVQRLRLAVVSCSNHAFGYFNAYRRVAERADLDAVVHLGDYLYEYGPTSTAAPARPSHRTRWSRWATTGCAMPSTSVMPTCKPCTSSTR